MKRISAIHVLPLVRFVTLRSLLYESCAARPSRYASAQAVLTLVGIIGLVLKNVLLRLLGNVLRSIMPCFFTNVRAVVTHALGSVHIESCSNAGRRTRKQSSILGKRALS